MRLAFQSVDSVKQIALLTVGGPHPVCCRPGQNQRQKEEFTPFFPRLTDRSGTSHLISCSQTETQTLLSWFSGLRMWAELATGFPASPACRAGDGTQPSQFLVISQSVNQSLARSPSLSSFVLSGLDVLCATLCFHQCPLLYLGHLCSYNFYFNNLAQTSMVISLELIHLII